MFRLPGGINGTLPAVGLDHNYVGNVVTESENGFATTIAYESCTKVRFSSWTSLLARPFVGKGMQQTLQLSSCPYQRRRRSRARPNLRIRRHWLSR